MQYQSRKAPRRRSRPRATGRSWGTSATTPRAKSTVRADAAEQALTDVLGLFEDAERLPAAIAQTMIARQEGTSPMVNWSLPNQLLCIMSGTSDARGFRQWNDVGRKVKKGSKSIRILAPRTRKITETDAATGEDRERVLTLGFLGVPVFRYEDTEGAPLEVPSYEPATFPPLYERAGELGVDVSYAAAGNVGARG
jgi:antirestriction factor ArdC-like protein